MRPVKKGKRYELELAKEYGRRQPGSGSQSYAKEDINGEGVYKDFLIQAKNKEGQNSFSLNVEKDLRPLRINSSRLGKIGIMMINFGQSNEYVVMRSQDFEFLVDEAIKKGYL